MMHMISQEQITSHKAVLYNQYYVARLYGRTKQVACTLKMRFMQSVPHKTDFVFVACDEWKTVCTSYSLLGWFQRGPSQRLSLFVHWFFDPCVPPKKNRIKCNYVQCKVHLMLQSCLRSVSGLLIFYVFAIYFKVFNMHEACQIIQQHKAKGWLAQKTSGKKKAVPNSNPGRTKIVFGGDGQKRIYVTTPNHA